MDKISIMRYLSTASSGETVFGSIQTLNPGPVTIVFIITLAVIAFVEFIFKALDFIAERNNLIELFKKLQYELMLLGIISFIEFLVNQTLIGIGSPISAQYSAAFETVHLLVIFIAFCFIAQALILVQFAKTSGDRFLKIVNTPESELLEEYDNLQEIIQGKHGRNFRVLTKMSKFWKQVEFKIIQELFLETHLNKVPPEFNFGRYTGYLYHTYISEVGDISFWSWGTLALLGSLNYAQLGPSKSAASEDCSGPTFENENGTHCYYYYFGFSLLAGAILNIALIFIYIFSVYYVHMLIRSGIEKVFKVDIDDKYHLLTSRIFHSVMEEMGLYWFAQTNHDIYIKCLECLLNESDKFRSKVKLSQEANHIFHVRKLERSQASTSFKYSPSENQRHGQLELHLDAIHRRESIDRVNNQSSNIISEESHIVFKCMYKCLKVTGIKHAWTNHHEIAQERDDIFLLSRPRLFFWIVELAFLCQSLYLAYYLSQLLPACVMTGSGGWGIALILSAIISFLLLREILKNSILLYATTSLHKEMVDRVCEVDIQEAKVADDVRQMILRLFRAANLSDQDIMDSISHTIDSIDQDMNFGIDKFEFKEFLDKICDIHLSKNRFRSLWSFVNKSHADHVSKDEIILFLFPKERQGLQDDMRIVYNMRKIFKDNMKEKNIPRPEWELFLRHQFEEFDTDNSGTLELLEIYAMFLACGIKSNEQQIRHLMGTLHLDKRESFTFSDFVGLLIPQSTVDVEQDDEGMIDVMSNVLRFGRSSPDRSSSKLRQLRNSNNPKSQTLPSSNILGQRASSEYLSAQQSADNLVDGSGNTSWRDSAPSAGDNHIENESWIQENSLKSTGLWIDPADEMSATSNGDNKMQQTVVVGNSKSRYSALKFAPRDTTSLTSPHSNKIVESKSAIEMSRNINGYSNPNSVEVESKSAVELSSNPSVSELLALSFSDESKYDEDTTQPTSLSRLIPSPNTDSTISVEPVDKRTENPSAVSTISSKAIEQTAESTTAESITATVPPSEVVSCGTASRTSLGNAGNRYSFGIGPSSRPSYEPTPRGETENLEPLHSAIEIGNDSTVNKLPVKEAPGCAVQ